MKSLTLRLFTGILAVALATLVGCSDQKSPLTTTDGAASSSTNLDQIRAELQSEIDATIDQTLVPRLPQEFSEQSASGWTSISSSTTITESGFYRVSADFAATGDGIVIMADYVVLNLGSKTITGPGSKVGRGIVVDQAKHVCVYGGTLTNFGIGVNLNGSSHVWVRGITVLGADDEANPPAGIAPQIGMMLVNSSHNYIFANSLYLTNLGLFVRGGGSYENGIFNNVVLGGDRGLLAICYNPAMGEGPAGPMNDLVRHNLLARYGTGIQTSSESAANVFRRNSILYFGSAYEDFNGTNVFEKNRSVQLVP